MPFEDYIDGAAYTRVSSGKQEELSPAAQKAFVGLCKETQDLNPARTHFHGEWYFWTQCAKKA